MVGGPLLAYRSALHRRWARVLPATAGSSVWVVVPEGCTPSDPPDCGNQRGFLFYANRSSSWYEGGPSLWPAARRYSVAGLLRQWRFRLRPSPVGLARRKWNDPRPPGRRGHRRQGFLLGATGPFPAPGQLFRLLRPAAKPVVHPNSPKNEIPSASWGYTAGAFYRLRQPFGSLTLGGYDAARFTPNNVTFGFGADTSKILLVGIQSIVTSNGDSLLPDGIVVLLDSTVPDIWVPQGVLPEIRRPLLV